MIINWYHIENGTGSQKIEERRKIKSKEWLYYNYNNDDLIINFNGQFAVIVNPTQSAQSRLMFDKNMNHVCSEKESALYSSTATLLPYYIVDEIHNHNTKIDRSKYVVINRRKFIESRGKVFAVRHKVNMHSDEIKLVRTQMLQQMQQIEDSIVRLSSILDQSFEKDSYELILSFNPFVSTKNETKVTKFVVITKFSDLKITNSIEQEYLIHELHTYLYGYFHADSPEIFIRPHLFGMRTRFNYKDFLTGYAHSHLPSKSLSSFSQFCLGDSRLFNSNLPSFYADGVTWLKYSSDFDLEAFFMALGSYLEWESLEGGPYMKMENISLYGNKVRSTYYKDASFKGNSVNGHTVTKVFNEISCNIDEFKPAFTIKVPKNGKTEFVCNYKMFVEKAVDIINRDKKLATEIGLYIYSSNNGEFAKITSGDDYTIENGFQVIEQKVKIRLDSALKSYMGGEVRDVVVKKDEDESLDPKNVILSCNPEIYVRIANRMLLLLNQELAKNEHRTK